VERVGLMDDEPYRWVLEEHKLSSRPPALSAIVLLAFVIWGWPGLRLHHSSRSATLDDQSSLSSVGMTASWSATGTKRTSAGSARQAS
jgi:hypothetical protein